MVAMATAMEAHSNRLGVSKRIGNNEIMGSNALFTAKKPVYF
jgi:hypothetical protein